VGVGGLKVGGGGLKVGRGGLKVGGGGLKVGAWTGGDLGELEGWVARITSVRKPLRLRVS
jgi:hypothetical protein